MFYPYLPNKHTNVLVENPFRQTLRLVTYKPVAVKVIVFRCTQLTNRTINVRTRIEKDKIVVLFASSTFFYLFFFESYEKCKQKM